MMRLIFSVKVLCSFCVFAVGQGVSKTNWYSETTSNGVTIQNSFPKGGPYPGPVKKNFNYSYLVFFSRVVNESATPLELTLNFSADSIAIPHSPETFVKLFLPADTMTFAKQSLFSYGVKALESFDNPTRFQKTLNPGEECLFNVVAVFYQTRPTEDNQPRGGNRAELVLKGQDLFSEWHPRLNPFPAGKLFPKNDKYEPNRDGSRS